MLAANIYVKFKLQFTFSLQIAKTCSISCPILPVESKCFLRDIFCINITLWQVYITAGFFYVVLDTGVITRQLLLYQGHQELPHAATSYSVLCLWKEIRQDLLQALCSQIIHLTLRKLWKVCAGPSSKLAKYPTDKWAEHIPQSPQLMTFWVQEVRGNLWCKNCGKKQVKNKKQGEEKEKGRGWSQRYSIFFHPFSCSPCSHHYV